MKRMIGPGKQEKPEKIGFAIQPRRAIMDLGDSCPRAKERYDCIRLDMNENPVDQQFSLDLPANWTNTYPDYQRLIAELASLFHLQAEEVLPTNGADEAIQLVCQTFIEPGVDTAILSQCGFLMIETSLRIAGAKLVKVPLSKQLDYDCDLIESAIQGGVKLVFLASPDNPTGALVPPQTVLNWCKQYPQVLFVIDEAYSEYSQCSLTEHVQNEHNLIVLKSFSKAWGMAGLRLGAICGSASLLSHIAKARLCFSVNAAAVWAAYTFKEREPGVLAQARETLERKVILIEALKKRGLRIVEGAANFLLLYLGESSLKICAYLESKKILVRIRSAQSSQANDPLFGMARVTVGTAEQNELFVSALDEFFAQNPQALLSLRS